jgi:hypothetical protein
MESSLSAIGADEGFLYFKRAGRIMNKITFIFLIVFGFTILNITQATAGCNIVWWGSYSGSTPTNETSRTEQATYETYDAICPTCGTQYCAGLINYGCGQGVHYGCFEIAKPTRPFTVCQEGSYNLYYINGGWDVICETLIALSSFSATPKAGKVIVQWNTEAETDNAGFNIYRADSEDGEYIKINTSLISAKGSSTQGASYGFIDTDVQNRKTYYYKLEDIDLNGKSTMHGPVKAVPRLIYGMKK